MQNCKDLKKKEYDERLVVQIKGICLTANTGNQNVSHTSVQKSICF